MKTCKKCGRKFPVWVTFNGVRHSLNSRRYCLECVPFKSKQGRTPDEKRTANAIKSRKTWEKQKEILGCDPTNARRKQRKQFFLDLVGGCQFCGYNKCAAALEFHHIRDKTFPFASIGTWHRKLPNIVSELSKCAVACTRCHVEIHHELIDNQLVLDANLRFSTLLLPYANISLWREIIPSIMSLAKHRGD